MMITAVMMKKRLSMILRMLMDSLDAWNAEAKANANTNANCG